ncbi:Signal transduction histidine kinase [Devosia enhydra]|uniref:histidine kinase n=1 Tax=Devosia enhydra TaxID=665118 RepID=A0A1K2I3M7_9HYPH|nr:HAMP domain-containing sensor histidine kinase [Devosia enhydra]SFZ86827.1 Signal transduction histidine kinase [Devosia enhydra]
MRRASLALRLALLAIGASIVALALAGILISGLLRQFVEETYDASLDAAMVAVMASTAYDGDTGRLSLDAAVADPRFEQPYSGWYWQVGDAGGTLIRSGSLWTSDLVAPPIPAGETIGRAAGLGPRGEALRLATRGFSVPGSAQRLVITAALPQAEIETRLAGILTPLVISLVLLGLGLTLAIVIQVRIGLKPLRQLRAELARIGAGEIETLPPARHAEIAPLVDEINRLLETSRTTLARARTHVGNLAHGLKTPLAVITSALEKARGGSLPVAGIPEATETMNRLVVHHLARARSAAAEGGTGSRADLELALSGLLPVFRGIHADRRLALELTVEPDLAFAGERQDLDEMLGNLIDNACKWGVQRITISAARADEAMLEVVVVDDGPGLAPAEALRATERGQRFDETRPGSGLGLAIVSDLATLYGGSVRLERAEGGGTRARLTLPAAPTTRPRTAR